LKAKNRCFKNILFILIQKNLTRKTLFKKNYGFCVGSVVKFREFGPVLINNGLLGSLVP
jgi:hypothetical protein